MQHHLPEALLQSLQEAPGFNQEAFIAAHVPEKVSTSIRFNPVKQASVDKHSSNGLPSLPLDRPVPWCPHGHYLTHRPSFTFDPLFHAGLYYVQEASSMFLWYALEQHFGLQPPPLKILDLCGAPGGKSTLLASFFTNGLLVSNEVIKSRAAILAENMTKWGANQVVVTNNDPKDFQRLPHFFDVLVIDAPCSGSGLFRKDKDAVDEWSLANVQLCTQRQQRILADAWNSLAIGGLLVYATCSFSPQEDEEIADWMMEHYKLRSIELQPPAGWNIVATTSRKHGAYGYRFYPYNVQGEGFFLAAFVKEEGDNFYAPAHSLPALHNEEKKLWNNWINTDLPLFIYKQKDHAVALPAAFANEITYLQKNLYLKLAGTHLGQVKGKDVIPHHALALSNLCNRDIPQVAFNKEEAIAYLQKKEVALPAAAQRGWHLASYGGLPLGWMKILPNRINNYYPVDWRILKAV